MLGMAELVEAMVVFITGGSPSIHCERAKSIYPSLLNVQNSTTRRIFKFFKYSIFRNKLVKMQSLDSEKWCQAPRAVTILVHRMSGFSLTSSLLVRQTKLPVTGCFIETFLVYRDFAIHILSAKQAHVSALPPSSASAAGGIKK
ncbi:unnamed protein product [Ixodes pacificus]